MPTVDFRPKVEREINRIKSSGDLAERDREVLLEYARDLKIEDPSPGRIFKVLVHTRKFAERLDGKGLADAPEDDLKDLVEWVQSRDLADSTKRDYREMLKRFFK
ncbi:hypothetical protein AKJ63_02060 [candidate division MSBL1 archaeon SCGC-AAA259D18]|uniref:Core-binding (CB) domain-containing protein n=1 Tax=candidate division MSBL1 archaeon SCGC-AAA259D18 TaxID=1698262 RepID=A0A133U9V9_9EURY|nr:hypothetical protein AKJ63_02060 [candidate division MSBL1 archaeon SCGC-AAA259D18]